MPPLLALLRSVTKRSPALSKAMAGVSWSVNSVFAFPTFTDCPKTVPLATGHTLTFPLSSLS